MFAFHHLAFAIRCTDIVSEHGHKVRSHTELTQKSLLKENRVLKASSFTVPVHLLASITVSAGRAYCGVYRVTHPNSPAHADRVDLSDQHQVQLYSLRVRWDHPQLWHLLLFSVNHYCVMRDSQLALMTFQPTYPELNVLHFPCIIFVSMPGSRLTL